MNKIQIFNHKQFGEVRTMTNEGEQHTRTYLVWTERGRKFIHRICKQEEVVIPFMLTVEMQNNHVQ